MKKLYLPCLILLSVVSSSLSAKITDNCCLVDCIPDNSCDCEVTSRSYLAVRPQFQSASPEMVSAFRGDRTQLREDGKGAVQAVIFGGKSTNSEALARYFFFNCKSVLITDERGTSDGQDLTADAPPSQPRDLMAQHFNIHTVDGDFRSQIAIEPEQSVVGLGLHARQTFAQNEEKGRGWYASISFPIERVKNTLSFTEDVISDGGGVDISVDENAVANMTEAFNQEEWRFGKINTSCCNDSKTGVADIEAKIGYEWLEHEPCHLETYLGVKIPTGNKPSAEYLFEPIVGNGKHWGIMFGNAIGAEVYRCDAKDRVVRIEYNANSQYLFRNTQCRSLDLRNKPWSRYIEMYSSMDQAIQASQFADAGARTNFATPGINLLTIPLKVRPGFQYDGNAAVVLKTKNYQFEAGYNFYCCQSECLKLKCPWVEGPVIKHRSGNGQQNPVRDITGNFRLELINPATAANRMALADYKYNLIKQEDLDLNSAASPCMLTHTVYATAGYDWNDRNYPMFVNLGGSYEFSKSNNAVMERWLVWFKGGLSY